MPFTLVYIYITVISYYWMIYCRKSGVRVCLNVIFGGANLSVSLFLTGDLITNEAATML